MSQDLDEFDLMHIALAICQAGAAAVVAKMGPDGPLPMHFNLAGEADRYGSRFEAVWLLIAGSVITLALDWYLRSRVDKAEPSKTRALFASRLMLVLVLSAITALVLALGFGAIPSGEASSDLLGVVLSGLWLIFIVLGAFIGKTSPNPVLGIRTFWTRHSRLAWDKANRLAGRIYFLGGIAGVLLTPLLSRATAVSLFLAVAIGGAFWAAVESWRVWRADPERMA